MADVRFEEVEKVYDNGVRAVQDLSLEISDGEFLVLVGPSGCGKTTALRMVAGLEEISDGTLSIGGRVVNELTPKERDIAMVFQNYALYPHLSVAENIAFGLRLRKTSKDVIAQRVGWAARLLDLTPYLERRPKQLSGGQRQRVAMGRAIVRQPQVFLMDEPLSNLDAKLRVQTRTQIATLQAKLGTTTVYVTHDQVEAMTMGHRVAVLLDGVLQQVDTPRNLYDRPANVFVGGFMGSPAMNIKTVPLTEQGAAFAQMILPLTREQIAAAHADGGNGRVTIGFRPDDSELVGAHDGGLPVVVELVEDLGSDANIYGHAALDGGAERFTIRTDRRHMPTMGDTVFVRPRPEHLHVFHAQTGLRL
jgi:multiple sugar transport system ATP-binding protein